MLEALEQIIYYSGTLYKSVTIEEQSWVVKAEEVKN